MKRVEKVKKQLKAIKFLKFLKNTNTYEELSDLTGFSSVTLNRYIMGRVLPDIKRAEEIVDLFGQDFLEKETEKLVRFDEDGYIDNSELIFNTSFMETVADLVSERFDDSEKVLTAASDGIPLGVHIGKELGVNCIFAKSRKEIGIDNFVEVRYKLGSGRSDSYFIPKGSLNEDKVLIIDDLIRTGDTQKALIKMAKKTNSEIVGVFTLISVEEGLEEIKDLVDCPVQTLLKY